MKDIFLNVLEAGLQGCVIIALVLILRLVLKTAPRRVICLLWLVAGLRLLLPFQIESVLSLQPDSRDLFQPQTQSEFFQSQPAPAVPDDAVLPNDVEIVTGDAIDLDYYFEYPVQQPIVRDWRAIAARVWLIGVCAMAIYSGAAYLALRRRVRMAVKVSRNVYHCAGLDTAFVLGFFRPRIYLPAENGYVLAHERAHIRRGDHWFKLLGFAALALHWFNPLVWVAYLLLCRDLEMACDEAVVRDMDLTERKAYSAALLACAARRSAIAACPVAFGEVSVKQRIVSVLNYRKPRFWICVIAAAAVLMVAVCFLTSPGGMTRDEALDAFYAEMDAIQSSEKLHLSYTMDTESTEFDAVELIGQEFWLDGDIWYRTFEYATDEGHFTTCYAEIGGVPYAREYSHDMENFTDRDWQLIPAENSANMPVLTTDWRSLEVLEVHRDRTHGGAYVIKLQGDMSDAAPTDTYYQKYWDIHLDANGRLLCMHLFTHGEFYMYYADTSGIYESRTYSTLTVEPWDDTWKEELADLEAYQKGYGENADTYAAVDCCQLALRLLQRQENTHMVVQWTSLEEEVDYHQEYWKNGGNWLYTSQMGDANVAAMELSGVQFLAETFENGEYQWAQTALEDEAQYKHWLASFEFDYNRVAFAERKGGLDGDQSITIHVITARVGDVEEGYPVTFHLKNGHELVSVEYKAPARDLNTPYGDYSLTATVTILPTDAAEAKAAIDAQIQIMRGQV